MDRGGEYSLKWNSHKTTVMSAFTCLFENEKHADCTLAAEGRTIKVHKVMISACSPYLERVLEEHSKDKNSHPIVIFNDMTFFELKALCEYMYKGEVNVPKEHLDSFLKVAKCMQVRGLCDGGGGDSIGGSKPPVVGPKAVSTPATPEKRKPQEGKQMTRGAKRGRQDGFDSDTSAEGVSVLPTTQVGRGGKQPAKQARVVATCSPRVVQEVKPAETVKQEETETVYEETVYQDLTFEEEIYQDSASEAGPSASDPSLEFGNWNDGNSNDFNQDSNQQDQDIQAKMAFNFNQTTEMYECVNCPKAYKKLQVLYRHIEFECEAIQRKPCPFEPCRYATLRKKSLMKHIMNIHGDD